MNFGLFARKLLAGREELLEHALEGITDRRLFFRVLREKVTDIYMRVADIEAGDNLSLQLVQLFSRENMQNQLNRHHFSAASAEESDRGSEFVQLKFEDIINVSVPRNIWQLKSCVLVDSDSQSYLHTYGHYEFMAENILNGTNINWFATSDLKQIRKSLEGVLLLQNLFAFAGLHNDTQSTLILAMNMATFCGRRATDEPISALTRNGISAIMPPDATLSEILFEDCGNKLERKVKRQKQVRDTLQSPFSRLVCGMPTRLGATSFDLISYDGTSGI